MKKKEWERLAKNLEGEVTNAQIHNEKLQREIDCWQSKQSVQFEQRPSSSAGHHVMLTRPAGSKHKPQNLVPLMMPQTCSTETSTKTMTNRAKELMKVK